MIKIWIPTFPNFSEETLFLAIMLSTISRIKLCHQSIGLPFQVTIQTLSFIRIIKAPKNQYKSSMKQILQRK